MSTVFRNDVRDLIESVSVGFVGDPRTARPRFSPAKGSIRSSSLRSVVLLLTYRNLFDVITQGRRAGYRCRPHEHLSRSVGLTPTCPLAILASDLAFTGRHRHHGHVRLSVAALRIIGFRAIVRGTFFSSWIASRAMVAGGGVQDTIAPRFALWDVFLSQRLARRLSAFLTLDNLA